MGTRIPDDKRAQILADAAAGELSCRAIGEKYGVSHAIVSKLAKEAGVTFAAARQTGAAAVVAKFDAKKARVQLTQDLYEDAQRLRGRMWSKYTQVVSGPLGPELVTTNLPPLRDQQSAMTSIGIAVDKASKLEDRDTEDGSGVGKTMVNDLFGALQLAYHQMVTEEAPIDLEAPMDTYERPPGVS